MSEPDDPLCNLLEEAAEKLGEHFEGVIILASLEGSNGAQLYHQISGPWHTAVGMVEHFKWSNIARRLEDSVKGEENG